jgi:hypothetical protein
MHRFRIRFVVATLLLAALPTIRADDSSDVSGAVARRFRAEGFAPAVPQPARFPVQTVSKLVLPVFAESAVMVGQRSRSCHG